MLTFLLWKMFTGKPFKYLSSALEPSAQFNFYMTYSIMPFDTVFMFTSHFVPECFPFEMVFGECENLMRGNENPS